MDEVGEGMRFQFRGPSLPSLHAHLGVPIVSPKPPPPRLGLNTMGRSSKMISTGSGIAIEAGANVAVTQLLVHDPLGTIGYFWPIHWACHVNIAHADYERLVAIHEEIAKLDPGPNKVRLVSDELLLRDAYDCGSSMVSNAVRSIRHLTQAMATHGIAPLTTHRAIEQIKEATAALGIDCRITDPGYDAFGELVRIRDAIEHPTESNVYQGTDSTWDQVPLAWILSDRSVKTYVAYRHWFDLVVRDWKALLAADAQPATLTIERGMASKHPAKKPKGDAAA